MADTIITNVPNLKDNESDSWWGAAFVGLAIALVVGMVFLYRTEIFQAFAPTAADTTNVNVIVPTPTPTPTPAPPAAE